MSVYVVTSKSFSSSSSRIIVEALSAVDRENIQSEFANYEAVDFNI